jgi:radical SAM superfamily enzyme YgiQ (UPF0313 family)
MKITLINPAFNRYGGVKGHGGSAVPLNLCYLAAYTRQVHSDIEFQILDSELRGLSHEETAAAVVSSHADMVGITTNTCSFDSVISLTHCLKHEREELPVVLGGPHVSALPKRSLEESGADFVVMGEGECTFEELIAKWQGGAHELADIKGLAYRAGDGRIRINAPRDLVIDLDVLPFPARDLVHNSLYSPAPTKRVSLGPDTLIAASRGCPHNCGFCGARTVWTRRIRFREPTCVVAEMEECSKKYGIRSFHFTDEFFTADSQHVARICELLIESGLRVSWVCSARAQGLDRDLLQMMRRAGCREISFGIESGNAEMLSRIDKRIDLDEAVRVVNLTKKAGIKTHASYMFGYLGETEESIRDTIAFAKRLNTHVAAFFIASPLPGTRFYEEAVKGGFLNPDSTWINYSPLSNQEPVLSLPSLSASAIRRWHRTAIRQFYVRPRYILLRLLSIRNWCDIVNLVGGLKILFRIRR